MRFPSTLRREQGVGGCVSVCMCVWVGGGCMQGWMHKETDYQVFNPINFLAQQNALNSSAGVPPGSLWIKLCVSTLIKLN